MIDSSIQLASLGKRTVSCGHARDCPCAYCPFILSMKWRKNSFVNEWCRSKIQQEELKGI